MANGGIKLPGGLGLMTVLTLGAGVVLFSIVERMVPALRLITGKQS